MKASRGPGEDFPWPAAFGNIVLFPAWAFPFSTAQVEAFRDYLEQHRTEVMAEYQKIIERIARGSSAEVEARLQGSRARLLALQKELQGKSSSPEVHGAGNPG